MLIKEPSPGVMHRRIPRQLQRILEDFFWETDSREEMTVVQPSLFTFLLSSKMWWSIPIFYF